MVGKNYTQQYCWSLWEEDAEARWEWGQKLRAALGGRFGMQMCNNHICGAECAWDK